MLLTLLLRILVVMVMCMEGNRDYDAMLWIYNIRPVTLSFQTGQTRRHGVCCGWGSRSDGTN